MWLAFLKDYCKEAIWIIAHYTHRFSSIKNSFECLIRKQFLDEDFFIMDANALESLIAPILFAYTLKITKRKSFLKKLTFLK